MIDATTKKLNPIPLGSLGIHREWLVTRKRPRTTKMPLVSPHAQCPLQSEKTPQRPLSQIGNFSRGLEKLRPIYRCPKHFKNFQNEIGTPTDLYI
jgi:hypothetical protein